jgi:hypothetical protein
MTLTYKKWRAWWPSGKEAWSLPAGRGSIPRPAPIPVVASKESRAPGGPMSKKTLTYK